MEIFAIGDSRVVLDPVDALAPPGGFLWIDCTHDEVAANPEAWRAEIARLTGVTVYDLHLQDILNLRHPSHFDTAQDYQLVVFRKLAPESELGADSAGTAAAAAAPAPLTGSTLATGQPKGERRGVPNALSRLATRPVSFLVTEQALVSVHASGSRTIAAARLRLLEYKAKPNGSAHASRQPASPADLMLRLLNAMVDQYLELRAPLTLQVERWQRALMDPERPFTGWSTLLDARNSLHKLDNMCEEQHDALQELRDHLVDSLHGLEQSRADDLLLVRLNDVLEHITRVLSHSRRLESSLESAVQIHFSAMSHRTSEIMRTLTVITALFMPLTLITGIFGMNFVDMPLLKDGAGFWITMALMAVLVAAMLWFFRRKHFLED
ncbi:MAG: magnesium transporter CorA family protein [Janthinobacterium lividum]